MTTYARAPRIWSGILIMLIVLTSGPIFALNESIALAQETQSGNLQVSGGIAMPATSSAVFTNPAGLLGASTSVVLQAAAPDFWDNGTYRAGLQTGGSSYGVAGGIEDRDFGQNNPLYGYYGLAVGTGSFTLGVAGRTGVVNSSGTALNAGALFSVGSSAKIGITARDINQSVSEWGAGVAFGVGQGVDLVFDSAADNNLKNIEVKPGLKVGSQQAALTISYGTGAREEFADGFSAGASFQFASRAIFEVQYNAGGDLSKYYASLAFPL
jgi:hypothetical protein